jgi:hypothetical protein
MITTEKNITGYCLPGQGQQSPERLIFILYSRFQVCSMRMDLCIKIIEKIFCMVCLFSYLQMNYEDFLYL